MLRNKLIFTALFATSTLFSQSLMAVEKNTEMPKQCQKLFNATDKLIADAERQPGTHPQVSKIKNKLKQSKEQILEMEVATQIKSCESGLAKLTSLKQDNQSEENN